MVTRMLRKWQLMEDWINSMTLQDVVAKLKAENRLVTIKNSVSPLHELAGVAKKFEGRQAVLFERVHGHEYPVLIGLWWNRSNVAAVFNTDEEQLPFLIANAVKEFQVAPIAPIVVANPPCQEILMSEADLLKIPTPTLALEDGGAYFSNAVIVARDPDTGIRNTSVHRVQIKGKNKAAMLMDTGRHLRNYYERAEKDGKALDITINIGVPPAVYIAAITPSSAAPIDTDELGIAAVLDGNRPVQLSQSKLVDVEGIAEAQVVIEASIIPYERVDEGPFGEVSGYYAECAERWAVDVKAITHRKSPIIHSLLPGKEVWNSVGLTAEANIFKTVSNQIPGLKKVSLSHGGCGFYGAIIQIDAPHKGMAKNAILSTFAAFPPLHMVIAVNSDVEIDDAEDVFRAMATRCVPDEDIIVIPKCFGHELNPATNKGFGAKMGFDCTVSLTDPAFKRVRFVDVNLENYIVE